MTQRHRLMEAFSLSIVIVTTLIWTHGVVQGEILRGEFKTFDPRKEEIFSEHYKTCAVRSCSQCASLCLKGRVGSPVCGAFRCEAPENSCDLHSVNSWWSQHLLVELYLFKVTDIFHPIVYKGRRYSVYLSSLEKKYTDARVHCLKMGAYLFEFESVVDYEVIRMVVTGHKIERSYVGANDIASEGVWVSDRTQTVIDTDIWQWNSLEPNNGWPDEDCAAIHYKNYRLNDIDCMRPETFLCQKNV